ncbi:26S proteasome non-ATPase regulatory subunit 10-like [Branchiostoma lanceolatum]|uniref:26S proteasome non-ATPase regulatory subunit 10-like n=1 Tax=Branchiostoma lanceolatum TaxID=7740 RepID=UPI0034558283
MPLVETEMGKKTATKAKPLITAASAGHYRKVCQLLDNGADLDVRDKDGRTALHRAVKNGHLKVVDCLLRKGNCWRSLRARDPYGWAAIHYAAQFNNKNNVISMLLDRGADPSLKTYRGWTALQQAAYKGDCYTIACLLSHEKISKRSVLSASQVYSRTALHYAVERGRFTATKLLLEFGADFNAKDIFGQTPLHRAAQENSVREVELLLLAGADYNAKDRNGKTPAEIAATGSKCQDLLLGHEQHHPSLQRLCRLKIHSMLEEVKSEDIKDFPLPPPMKNFLLFKNVL